MNATLIAAVCGFVFREALAIEGRSDKDRPFDPIYYVRKNWIALVLNTVGTIGLYVAIPELRVVGIDFGGDYPALTGFAVGLLGAWLVRKLQDAIKAKVEANT